MKKFIAFTLFNCLVFSLKAQTQIDFLIKPYLQYTTKNSVKILWETNIPSTTIVEYGSAQAGAEKPYFTDTAMLGNTRMMHEVELARLYPETNYFWRVVTYAEDGQKLQSDTYTFKTGVKENSSYMFALIGDPQQNNKTPWAWDSIANQIWKERPNFVVAAGDFVDWGHNKEEWVEEFLGPGHVLMSRVPLFGVLGNHEADADYYYQYMANPSPEYCYTFKYGNAEFFMIDTNRDITEGSDQYIWLEQQLAKSETTWKIAVHHHPPYSSESNDHGDTFNGSLSTLGHQSTRDLPKLYDKYGVDFSLFGHTHVYERTWPLKNGMINQKSGTIYINSGGAGGGLETFAPTRNWFTLELQETHHYCTFAIYENTLIFKAIDNKGRLFDTFQIDKDTTKQKVAVVIPPAPQIQSDKYVFNNETTITIESGLENLSIRYTLDGTNPNEHSKLYNGSLKITEGVELKARAYTQNGGYSAISSKNFIQMDALEATDELAKDKGLSYKLYVGDWKGRKDTYINNDNLASEGVLPILDVSDIQPDQKFWAVKIEGFVEVPETGTYTFYGIGMRGLHINLDGMDIIETNDRQPETVQLVLTKGKHKIKIMSFQESYRKAFGFGYYDYKLGRIPIKPFALSH